MDKLRSIFQASIILFVFGQVSAEPITISFSGEITEFNPFDLAQRTDLLSAGIDNGASFSGSFTYDLSTPDSNPDPSVGSYSHSISTSDISVTIGSLTVSSGGSSINWLVNNDWRADSRNTLDRLAGVSSEAVVSGIDFLSEDDHLEFFLIDFEFGSFPSDQLLSSSDFTGLILSDFEQRKFEWKLGGSGNNQVAGIITELAGITIEPPPVQVPTPSTFWLYGAGLIGLGLTRAFAGGKHAYLRLGDRFWPEGDSRRV